MNWIYSTDDPLLQTLAGSAMIFVVVIFLTRIIGLRSFAKFTAYDYSFLNYTKIDNKIIGYRYGQLWDISVSETELIAKELDNDGLDGISITSVSKFDDKVYLSTLSGVFYKIADEFFDYKIETE
jgi:hypothetical protein